MIKSINPATLEVNAEIPATPLEDVAGIVDQARQAQEKWAGVSLEKRIELLHRAKDYVVSNIDEFIRIITMDNGKTVFESMNAEIMGMLDTIEFVSKNASKILGDENLKSTIFTLSGLKSRNVFEPCGVSCIISPWNFPFANVWQEIPMALAAGNAVIHKPAEVTAWVGDLTRRIFEEIGAPPGLVSVLQGSGSRLGAEILKAGVDNVIFTGSVPVGKRLMAACAETLTPITLELGGKDPFIVLDDADVERAAGGAVWSAYMNAGQICASAERIYVHEKVADQFIDLVVKKTGQLRLGNGLDKETDMGPMISEDQLNIVDSHVKQAVEKGARVLKGGKRWHGLPGYFYEPTVLVDVDHSMDCMIEETFGPTMPIMRISSEDEAVALANDTGFGLTASVWTRSRQRAERMARRIKTGTVTANNHALTAGFAICPWGGVKESGVGRVHSAHGLRAQANIKNVTFHKAMASRDLWWHPYTEEKFKSMKSLLTLQYDKSSGGRAAHLVTVAKAFMKLLK
jgi:succinate-semialdehyde dehydrogenase/glutarate-semialdehyde dehydrogenase